MLKMKKTMYAVVSAVALCTAAITAHAKTAVQNAPTTTAPSGEQTQAKKSARAMPYYGKVGTVDKANKTFTIEGKKSTRMFTTTANTRMEKAAGASATIEDLKPGEYVRGSAMKKADGQYEAMSIKIGQKEKTASTAQPESKAKKQ